MSSGPDRRPGRVINPSSWPRTDVRMVRRDRGKSSPVRAAFVFNPKCPVTLKGIGSNRTTRVARRDRRGADRPSSLRISSDGRLILKPVEGDPPRHAITSVSACLLLTWGIERENRVGGGQNIEGECCAAGGRQFMPRLLHVGHCRVDAAHWRLVRARPRDYRLRGGTTERNLEVNRPG